MNTQSLHALLVEKRELLEKIIHKDLYRYQRYDVPFSVAIFYTTSENALDVILKAVRETDEVIKIDENFTCVIFGFVKHDDAYTGALNTLKILTKHNSNTTASVGLTSVTPSDAISDMVLRAIRNLHLSMQEKKSSVKDDSVIDFITLH